MKINIFTDLLTLLFLSIAFSATAFEITWHPLIWFRTNFHEVERGRCYRAKTLSKNALESYITKYNIKVILNIREANPKADWYKDEVKIVQKHGIQLHTITLDANKVPTASQIKNILAVFDNSRGPLLIHCRAGADRTGLVSALWKTEKMGVNLKEALEQQTVKYGHVEFWFPRMREFTKQWHRLKHIHNGDRKKMLTALA